MAQVSELVPGAAQAEKLARIHAQAFPPVTRWSASELTAFAWQQQGVIIADTDLQKGLLIVRCAADEGEILTLAAVPAARGQGLATALMLEGIRVAASRKVRQMFLEVAVDNAPALALYRRLGFDEVGRRRSYYLREDGIRVDALVLSLEIDD